MVVAIIALQFNKSTKEVSAPGSNPQKTEPCQLALPQRHENQRPLNGQCQGVPIMFLACSVAPEQNLRVPCFQQGNPDEPRWLFGRSRLLLCLITEIKTGLILYGFEQGTFKKVPRRSFFYLHHSRLWLFATALYSPITRCPMPWLCPGGSIFSIETLKI